MSRGLNCQLHHIIRSGALNASLRIEDVRLKTTFNPMAALWHGGTEPMLWPTPSADGRRMSVTISKLR